MLAKKLNFLRPSLFFYPDIPEIAPARAPPQEELDF
jgi:hypothetical protein